MRNKNDSQICLLEPATYTMTRKIFLEVQKRHLIDMRREALNVLEGGKRDAASMATEDGKDPADLAERDVETSARLQMAGHGFEILREIDDALVRLSRGVYGICELSGKEIPEGRLEAMPFARYTVDAQAQFERRGRVNGHVGAGWGTDGEETAELKETEEADDADT